MNHLSEAAKHALKLVIETRALDLENIWYWETGPEMVELIEHGFVEKTERLPKYNPRFTGQHYALTDAGKKIAIFYR